MSPTLKALLKICPRLLHYDLRPTTSVRSIFYEGSAILRAPPLDDGHVDESVYPVVPTLSFRKIGCVADLERGPCSGDHSGQLTLVTAAKSEGYP